MTLKNIMKKNKEDSYVQEVTPVVNIRDEENAVVLEAEMPGLLEENISVEVQGDELFISGKRLNEIPKGYSSLYQERIPIEYKRTFTLGSDIDRGNIEAHYENGILAVKLKRSEDAQPRKIKVL